MERFHSSQIDWTRFVNRQPTSVSQLWPPSTASDSRDTTPDRSTLPTTLDTSLSEDDEVEMSFNQPLLTPPDLSPDHVQSIENLRAFVEKEIGVAAIDNRMSLPYFDRSPSTSWVTLDSGSAVAQMPVASVRNRRYGIIADRPNEYNLGSSDQSTHPRRHRKRRLLSNLQGKHRSSLSCMADCATNSREEQLGSQRSKIKSGAQTVAGKLRKVTYVLIGRAKSLQT